MKLVVAFVGTDHHPFDRAVAWLDESAVEYPEVRFVVQYGESRAPLIAEGHDYLPHPRILDLLAEAAVVVCHGGPGTIMDARSAGHVPICLPRDPALGEHVDGHQQRFAEVAHRDGMVVACTTQGDFREALAERLRVGRGVGALADGTATTLARERIAAGLEELIERTENRRRRRWFHHH